MDGTVYVVVEEVVDGTTTGLRLADELYVVDDAATGATD